MDKITNLKDLPSIWKDRQSITTVTKPEDFLTKDQIDGSSMTINPDKKFRLSRIITEADLTKYKRPSKIREMLNYCKFRLGDLATCSKPSPMVLNVLYNYKNGKIDKVPLGYMEAIKDYRELIDNAMAVDMRYKSNISNKTKSEKTKAISHSRAIQNKQTSKKSSYPVDTTKWKNVTKGKERFKAWLNPWLGLSQDERVWKQAYAAGLHHFILDGISERSQAYPESLRLALHEKPYVDMLANNEIKVNMIEQSISLNNTVFRASSVLAQPIVIQTNQQNKSDSLTSLVEQLKELGIREFSIKF